VDGQSRRIAERIAGRLMERGIPALPHDWRRPCRLRKSWRRCGWWRSWAAVRYGRHLPEAEHFLAIYRALRAPPPLVLLSVNLTARKPGKDTAQGNVYLRKSIAGTGLRRLLPWPLPVAWNIRVTVGWTGRRSASSCC